MTWFFSAQALGSMQSTLVMTALITLDNPHRRISHTHQSDARSESGVEDTCEDTTLPLVRFKSTLSSPFSSPLESADRDRPSATSIAKASSTQLDVGNASNSHRLSTDSSTYWKVSWRSPSHSSLRPRPRRSNRRISPA